MADYPTCTVSGSQCQEGNECRDERHGPAKYSHLYYIGALRQASPCLTLLSDVLQKQHARQKQNAARTPGHTQRHALTLHELFDVQAGSLRTWSSCCFALVACSCLTAFDQSPACAGLYT